MPKLVVETTPKRQAEIDRRVARSRAAVAALTPPARTETTHAARSLAERAASRVGCPNTVASAEETTHGWVGVVRIRPDQMWMVRQIEERGCRAMVTP